MDFKLVKDGNYRVSYLSNLIINLLLQKLKLQSVKTLYLDCDEDTHYDSLRIIKKYPAKDSDMCPFVNKEPELVSSKFSNGQIRFTVAGALVDSLSGRIYTEDKTFLGDISSWNADYALKRWPNSISNYPKRKIAKFSELTTFLPTNAYYHWLIEDLPPLLRVVAEYPNVKILIPKNAADYVISYLKLFNLNFDFSPAFFEAREIVCESRGPALVPQSLDVKTLEEWRAQLELTDTGIRKIYISRREIGRIPENENDIEILMKQLGVEIFNLTGMKSKHQIELFNSAELIIGTHGAGLTNIVWNNAGKTSLVELKTSRQPKCFQRLANQKNMKYLSVDYKQNSKWEVDIESLEKIVDEIS